MKLTQQTLPNYFTIADATSSWHTEPTNTFDFVSRDSKKLVVSVGDSWTWGSDLSEWNRDNEFRVENVYGHQLANLMQADWLNLGLCAAGNFWMATMIEELSAIVPELEYDSILVVVTMTEAGRWFNTKYDLYIDYIAWFEQINDEFDQLLVRLNQECVQRIQSALSRHSHVELVVGTNFVEPLGLEQLNHRQRLARPWYNLLGGKDQHTVWTCGYFERLSTGVEFVKPQYQTQYKSWVIQLLELAKIREQTLSLIPGFRNCHPDASGHETWAQYIFNHVESNK